MQIVVMLCSRCICMFISVLCIHCARLSSVEHLIYIYIYIKYSPSMSFSSFFECQLVCLIVVEPLQFRFGLPSTSYASPWPLTFVTRNVQWLVFASPRFPDAVPEVLLACHILCLPQVFRFLQPRITKLLSVRSSWLHQAHASHLVAALISARCALWLSDFSV